MFKKGATIPLNSAPFPTHCLLPSALFGSHLQPLLLVLLLQFTHEMLEHANCCSLRTHCSISVPPHDTPIIPSGTAPPSSASPPAATTSAAVAFMRSVSPSPK